MMGSPHTKKGLLKRRTSEEELTLSLIFPKSQVTRFAPSLLRASESIKKSTRFAPQSLACCLKVSLKRYQKKVMRDRLLFKKTVWISLRKRLVD